MNAFRSLLYALARLLGDVQAVRRGTVGRRVARRVNWPGHRPPAPSPLPLSLAPPPPGSSGSRDRPAKGREGRALPSAVYRRGRRGRNLAGFQWYHTVTRLRSAGLASASRWDAEPRTGGRKRPKSPSGLFGLCVPGGDDAEGS